MKITFTTLLAMMSLTSLMSQSAGQLDITFNTSGSQSLSPGILHDNINAVAVQSDEKIVGFGMTMGEGNFNFDLCIVRLMPDGAVDASFGTDGYFTYDHNGESDFIYEGTILPDGKILACGAVSNSADDTEIMLVRLNTDGTLDNTFGGGDGMAIHTLNTGQDYANGMIVLEDGSIVIVGTTAMPGMMTTRGVIMKFNSLGELDTTFGFNGYTVIAYGQDNDVFQSLVQMPDGGYMLVGYSSINFSNAGWVCRVTAAGDLDTDFATSGHYIYDSGIAAFIDIVAYGDEYIVCGNRFFGLEDAVVVGLQANGTLSTAFGTNGEVVLDIDESDATNKILVDSENGLVVAGSAGPSFFERNALAFRLDATGTLDPSFGNGGIFNVSFASGFDVIWGLAEQGDDKLILGGLASENDNNMLFVRINGSGTVGLDESNEHSVVAAYPNPVQHTLQLMAPSNIEKIGIYNMTGACVRDEKINSMQTSFDLSGLAEGCYTLHIVLTNGRTEVQRIMIARKR
jgi:uncharacterized delta-60 repeat protein